MIVLFTLAAAYQDLTYEEDVPDEQKPDIGKVESTAPAETELVPWTAVMGPVEYGAAFMLLLYVVVYFIGCFRIRKELERVLRALRSMRRYFYVVPSRFRGITRHEYQCYITGRRGYLGGLLTVQLSRRCDILGWLFDKIMGN